MQQLVKDKNVLAAIGIEFGDQIRRRRLQDDKAPVCSRPQGNDRRIGLVARQRCNEVALDQNRIPDQRQLVRIERLRNPGVVVTGDQLGLAARLADDDVADFKRPVARDQVVDAGSVFALAQVIDPERSSGCHRRKGTVRIGRLHQQQIAVRAEALGFNCPELCQALRHRAERRRVYRFQRHGSPAPLHLMERHRGHLQAICRRPADRPRTLPSANQSHQDR